MIPIYAEKEFEGRYRAGKRGIAFPEALHQSAVIFRNTDERYWSDWTEPGLHLVLSMDDIDGPYPGLVHATSELVNMILEWSRQTGRENLVCCCQAGISRSSAMACLIAYDRTKSVESAISFLYRKIHYPNRLLLRLGADILGCPDLVPAVLQRCYTR